ncbi:MAG: cbb3-type cytochrome c oxidase subunit I, partial [Spirochaetota bacterium]|nr:cbb3-type cytochrome c oxidase subunit I [Spirochaetota bacterium]
MSGHHEPGFIGSYVFSRDHKVIGMQYMLLGIVMAIIGGYLAYVFRMKLGFGQGVDNYVVPLFGEFSAAKYNSFVTSHALIMIFWGGMPVLVAAFGNFLIPTMIGCDDMAYPTLNMLSFWVFLLSAVVLILSFFTPDSTYGGGWTLYPPL